MTRIIAPLKQTWKLEDNIYYKDRIAERVNSEDNFTHCRGYPLTSELKGKLGKPINEK